MKKIIALILCTITVFAAGCADKNSQTKESPAPSKKPEVTASFTPDTTEGAVTAEPENETAQSDSPTASAAPKVTAVPTPTPTIRPAQTASIVPAALLTVGYTTPLSQPPAGYNMPYFIEVDVTNQCVNIFIKDAATGRYDILLNRFVCSGGTSTYPTKTGNFYILSDSEQKARRGQLTKYQRYYFQKWESYAYYITRYSDEYMFHSFTFKKNASGQLIAKNDYYNMGNPGSAGCLRMLMGHAKWIYENIDARTYCSVTKGRKTDSDLRSTLKKYLPPLGYDMTPSWTPGDNSHGLTVADFVTNPETIVTAPPATPTPTSTPTPTTVPSPSTSPSISPSASADPITTDENENENDDSQHGEQDDGQNQDEGSQASGIGENT